MQNITQINIKNFLVSCPSLLTGTSAPSVTTPENTVHPSVPILPLNTDTVDFLGLDLSPHDAKVALYVIFVFLLVSVPAMILAVYQLLKTRSKSKRAPAERMWGKFGKEVKSLQRIKFLSAFLVADSWMAAYLGADWTKLNIDSWNPSTI